MLKKIAVFFLLLWLMLFAAIPVLAQNNNVTIHFFWANGCPHCSKEKIFLNFLKDKYPQIQVIDYEVTGSRENALLLQKVGKELSTDVSGVPFTVIGKDYIAGYYNDEITGRQIEEKVTCAIRDGCEDIIQVLTSPRPQQPVSNKKSPIPENIHVPILGQIKTKDLSLPSFTFVIALLDGFNPCAMWVLMFLISLLIGMHDRLKMLVLGSAFIIASGFVYFLFLSAWLNLFLFLGLVLWIRLLIGIVAVFAGIYNLKDYFANKKGVCHVTQSEKKKKIFEKLKQITQKKQFIWALMGIILLAFAVNLVELVCSAGLPAIYTQVIALSKLPSWKYYLYLLFYIFVFMLDDLIVFIVAMTTLQAIGIDGKYSRFSHLVGGVVMLIIGVLMWFKPELLMFG